MREERNWEDVPYLCAAIIGNLLKASNHLFNSFVKVLERLGKLSSSELY